VFRDEFNAGSCRVQQTCQDSMMKITGLDKLTKQLKDAQRAFAEIDGELGSVSFDTNDPASIEHAIKNMEALVDARLCDYEDNPLVAPIAKQMKESYRQAIIDKAAAARLKGSKE
jgi:hypothetical protein